MKRELLLTVILVFSASAKADRAPGPIEKTSQEILMTSLCEGEGSFSKAAQCYITPSGERVWELQGEEKKRWMKVATKVRRLEIERELRDTRHKRQESDRRDALAEGYATKCRFWLDQTASAKKEKKIKKYCK
jgi:hypothetical protein